MQTLLSVLPDKQRRHHCLASLQIICLQTAFSSRASRRLSFLTGWANRSRKLTGILELHLSLEMSTPFLSSAPSFQRSPLRVHLAIYIFIYMTLWLSSSSGQYYGTEESVIFSPHLIMKCFHTGSKIFGCPWLDSWETLKDTNTSLDTEWFLLSKSILLLCVFHLLDFQPTENIVSAWFICEMLFLSLDADRYFQSLGASVCSLQELGRQS